MKNMTKFLAVGAALAATSMALAQTDTTNTGLLGGLSGLLAGGGVLALLVVGAIAFFLFRWWGGGGD